MSRLLPPPCFWQSSFLSGWAILIGTALLHGENQKNPAYVSYPPASGSYAYPPQPQPPVPPAYQPVPKPSSAPAAPRLADKVSQLAANDQRQDIRLSQLEKEVDQLSIQPGRPAQPPPAPPQPVPVKTYQVRKGDTLWRIAMNHRVSPGEIMAFNRMPNDTVAEGQVLMIPQKGAAGKTVAASGSAIHVVQPGETYSSIAPKYKISIDKLAKANPTVNPNKLQTGMKLVIPGTAVVGTSLAGTSSPPAPPPPAPAKKSTATHTVAAGESLSVIAAKHKVSTASLQKANNLANPNALRIGQQLIIPGGSGASSKTVAASSSSAAAKDKPKTTATSSSKGKTSTVPPAGSGIAQAPAYPGEPPKPPVAPTPPPSPPPGTNRQVVSYRLEPGDNIDTVAKDFGTSTAEIRRLNRLSSSATLKPGDEILVPGMGAVN